MKSDNLKSKTGIEMRAAAAARAQQADPSFAAKQHEASFLRHITTAKEHYDWIVDNEAWIQLGHATYTDWYLAKVQPILLALGARPTPELAGDVFNRVRDDEADLAPSQRRTQQEMAELTGLSRRTVQRLSQDLSGAPLAPGADLADSTVVDPVSLISDEAKAAIAARLDETSPGAAVPENGEEGAAETGGPAAPSEPPIEDPTSEESDPVVPVASSSAQPEAFGAPSGSAPAEQEEPASSPPAAERPQAEAGVTQPAAAPQPVETDEAKAERERLEFRTDRTVEFADALVNLTMRLGKDPIAWYEQVYLHDAYPDRHLPQVADCFEPKSLHRLATFLDALGEHLTQTGKTL